MIFLPSSRIGIRCRIAILLCLSIFAASCGNKTRLKPPELRRPEKVEKLTASLKCDRICLEWTPSLFDTRGDPLDQTVRYLVLRKRGNPVKWESSDDSTDSLQDKNTPGSTQSAAKPQDAGDGSAPPRQVADVDQPAAPEDKPDRKEILPAEFDFSLVAIVPGPAIDPAHPMDQDLVIRWEDTGVPSGPAYPAGATRFRIPSGFPPQTTDPGRALTTGYTYTYMIAVSDAGGRVSASSTPMDVRWIRIPAPPANVSVQAGPGRIGLTWTPPGVDCAGSPLERLGGYEIQRAPADAPDNFSKLMTIESGIAVQATDDTVIPDSRYLYRIRAYIEPSLNGEFSLPVAADTTDRYPPESPQHLSGAVQPAGVFLNWRPVADPDLAGYRLYRRTGESADFELLNPAEPIQNNSFVDRSVIPGMVYSYRVTAVDGSAAANESDPGNSWTVTLH